MTKSLLRCRHVLATLSALAGLAGAARAQAFQNNPGAIPSGSPENDSYTENVDFADVDLDGDWDAVFADGGDAGNDQNRFWVNQGGRQGGTIGVFVDDTAARLPAILDDSRDVEFVDIDGDSDQDLYVSNTSAITNQTNRWLVNTGFAQGGSVGYYVDQTPGRWIGLGGPGSSVPASAVLGGGGFVDWSCDCDFGDLDNDGDMDLVHSTYGGAFGGNVPTRLFLNDGQGFFTEFNPSGYQLTGTNIANGNPALWAEGLQSANTSNTSGLQADIATATLDIDVGDQDGDLDLDILHGDRNNETRWFSNRLEESGGTLGFRDVSHAVYAATDWATGGGNYEQELADVDNDGDLDLFGLNWNGFTDRMFRNDAGVFDDRTDLAGSSADDNEGDFLDYDNDGDLDLYVCNFSGQDKLYRNDDTGSGSVVFTLQSPTVSGLAATGSRGIDADACDVDKDGDYDVFVARDNGNANLFMENVTQVADTTAPTIWRLESVPDGAAGPGVHVVRAQVYDNAPYYITWYNPTALEVSVDGHRLPDLPMRSSGGQIFRGELPANLLGAVDYRARSSDEYGNAGFSVVESYTSTGGPAGTVYGTGTSGSLGVPVLEALSLPLPDAPLYLNVRNLPPATGVFLAFSFTPKTPALDLGDGLLLNVGIPVAVLIPLLTDANGDATFGLTLPSVLSGLSIYQQGVALDGTGGNGLASTPGLRIDVP